MNYHGMLVVSVKFRLQVILSVNLKPITISTADKHARPSQLSRQLLKQAEI